MTVLRELVARLGFQVDKAGFTAAERGVAGIRRALGASSAAAGQAGAQMGKTAVAAASMGREARKAKEAVAGTSSAMAGIAKLAAAAGLTNVITGMVQMASDANETSNVLKEVFGAEGLAQVENWAETMAVTMGRSKYDLRSYASALGAVLGPMVGNRDKAREMSTSLSQLAVDLGSFYNATDQDAMAALRSGLVGETEPLKRFGVVMTEATMQEYARTQGITKKMQAMTNAEKTELRYGFIMQATATAQGDAARTGDGFANATKGLKAALKDVGIEMGMTVIPRLEKVMRFARDGLTRFKALAQGTYILQGAFYTLAGVAALLALNLAAPFILPALAVLALIVAVDELHALFTGGRSVIGDWLDEFFGVGTAEELVHSVTDAFDWLTDTISNMPDVSGMFDLWKGAVDDVGFAIERVIEKFMKILDWTNWLTAAVPDELLTRDKGGALYSSGLLNLFGISAKQEEAESRSTERGLTGKRDRYGRALGTTAESIGEELELRQKDRYDQIRAEKEARTAARAELRRQREADRAKEREDALQSRDENEDQAAGMSVESGPRFGRARVRRRRSAPVAPGPAVPAAAAPSAAANPVVTPLASYASEPLVTAPAAPAQPEAATSSNPPNISVYIQGSTTNISGGDINEVRRAVREVNEAERRKTLAAIANQSRG